MARMKTFGKYLILFMAFYIFVYFMSRALVKSTYRRIEDYTIDVTGIEITVDEAKTSKVSGYIKGKIKRNSETEFKDNYVKVELISSFDSTIITRYIDISNLKLGEAKDFEVNYKAQNIETFKITTTNEKIEQKLEFNINDIIR